MAARWCGGGGSSFAYIKHNNLQTFYMAVRNHHRGKFLKL
jgi:hypothetical protein